MKILIKVAEEFDVKTLCALSCVSKQFAVAAQDVLYRFVDIRPEHPRHLALRKQQNSGIAMLAWTLDRKPHLAAKIRTLWGWPQTRTVEYELKYPGFSRPSATFITGPCIALVEEKRLAAELLTRLTGLQSMTLTAKTARTCYKEYPQPPSFRTSLPIFLMMPLRWNQFTVVPGFSQLNSLHLSHGQLDWAIITLPTLSTLCLGTDATIQLPCNDDTAPNVLTVIFESQRTVNSSELDEKRSFLRRLPNLLSLTLGSYIASDSKYHFPSMHNTWESPRLPVLLNWWIYAAPRLLESAPSVQDLVFTYGKQYALERFFETLSMLGKFAQLRKIQIAEGDMFLALVKDPGHRNVFCPPGIQELVINHPFYRGRNLSPFYHVDRVVPVLKLNFPDLNQVELVYFGGDESSECLDDFQKWSLRVQRCKAVGVTVKITDNRSK